MAEILNESQVLQSIDATVRLSRYSENFLSEREVNRVKEIFLEAVGGELGPDAAQASRQRAWAVFLLFLADSGFSAESRSADNLRVVTVDPDGVEATLTGEKFDYIIDSIEAEAGPRYTHQRLGNTLCRTVRSLLSSRGQLTNYGFKNHIPERFLEYAFPGAIFCPGIPEQVRTALSLAKNYALNRVEDKLPTTAADGARISIFH